MSWTLTAREAWIPRSFRSGYERKKPPLAFSPLRFDPQLALRIVSLQLRPKDIFRRFGSCEGALLVEARARKRLHGTASKVSAL